LDARDLSQIYAGADDHAEYELYNIRPPQVADRMLSAILWDDCSRRRSGRERRPRSFLVGEAVAGIEICFKLPMQAGFVRKPEPDEADLFQSRSVAVRVLHSHDAYAGCTDKPGMRFNVLQHDLGKSTIPWALEMKAVSQVEPARLVGTLTGAILGCGGWVLSRGASDGGTVNMLFEFERRACVDIYSVLVAAGIELSQAGHLRFSELCQCTRNQARDCGAEIASVDLEVQTFSAEHLARREAGRLS
jgi:hypothetical protein